MERLARCVTPLVKVSRFSTESTGVSCVTSTPNNSLEQRVLSSSKVDDTPELITLLHQILIFDPLQRPDASDLLNHPWFVGSSDLAVPSQPGWEDLPPSVFTTAKPNSADANQNDLTVALAATPPQGPPDGELEPPPLLLESSTATGTDTTPAPPVTQSLLPNIVTLSNSTTTDTPTKSLPQTPRP